MTTNLTLTPMQLIELDRVVSGLAKIRSLKSQLEAREAALLAAASSLACDVADTGAHPDGGSMAHRMIASVISAALRESDRTVTTRMGRAFTLITDYPHTHDAVSAGLITGAHAGVITDAGSIVTDQVNREHYEAAVLK
ncbi:MAG: hypothetical protein GX814_10815, partial [Microbacteriaceae bacterium]|nr:hypothetical protein [Microbacteriaceae bacterium]